MLDLRFTSGHWYCSSKTNQNRYPNGSFPVSRFFKRAQWGRKLWVRELWRPYRTMNFLLGCQYGNPSRKMGGICWVFFFLLGCRVAIPVGKWVDFSVLFLFSFSVSVKVLPVIPLVSGVFVHRAFYAYFLRIERVVEMRILLWWTQ